MKDIFTKHKEYLLLLLIPILVYGASINNGYNLDDELVIDNRFIGDGLHVIPQIFTENYFTEGEEDFGYRPIVVLSYFLETYFFGTNPAVSHLINLMLYVILGLFLYQLTLTLSQNKLISIIAVLLFLVHPLHVEVVASAKNREELLAFLFVTLAAVSSLKFIHKRNYLWLAVVVFCGVLSVLSKKSALPGLLMIPPAIILFRAYRLTDLMYLIGLILVLIGVLSPFPFDTLVILLTSASLFYGLLLGISQGNTITLFKAGFIRIPWFVLLHILALILVTYFPLKWMLLPVASGIVYAVLSGRRDFAHTYMALIAMAIGAWVSSEHIIIFSAFMVAWLTYQNKGSRQYQLYNWLVLGIGLMLLSWTLFEDFQPMFLFIIAYFGLSIHLIRKTDTSKFVFIGYTFLTVLILAYLTILTSNYVLFIAVLFTYLLLYIKDKKSLQGAEALLPYLLIILVLFQNELLLELRVLPQQVVASINSGDLVNQKSLLRDIGRQLHPTETVFTEDMGLNAKTATSVYILGEYLKLHFWPHPLRFYYGFAQITAHSWQSIVVWLYGTLYLLMGVSAIYLIRRLSLYSYGVIFFMVCILPFSNLFIPMAGMMGERLTFIASFGLCLAVANIIHWAFMRWQMQWGVFVIVGLMLVSLGYASYSRSLLWDNKLYLYENDIQYSEKSAKMNQLLGSLYFDASKVSGNEDHLQNAVFYLNRAKDIYPDYFIYWVILGLAYQQFDYFTDAIIHFKKAIELNPEFTDSYFNVAVCAEAIGDEQTAIDYYNAYIDLVPGDENGYTNFSFFYFKIGLYQEAVAIGQEVIDLFPNNPNHYLNLGKILLTINDVDGAIANFKDAASLNANDPMLYVTLSNLLREQGKIEEAEYYQAQAQRLGINN